MNNVEDKLKMFANEIGDIQDANLKQLATDLIENADDYFFTVAASSSGKYHPPFDLGNGGLVRHTRFVVFLAESVAESFNMTQYDKDCLIVAALAHDIKKQGDGSSLHTVWEHPIYAKDYVYEIHKKTKSKVPKDVIEKIGNAIERHMGKWGHDDIYRKNNIPLPMPETEFEKALNDMIVFDAIICNVDRHFGNFGFIVDNKTNKIIAPAPLFDHGNSLFNMAGRDDLESEEKLNAYAETLLPCVYDDFIATAKEVLTPEHREGLRKLLDFKFKKHPILYIGIGALVGIIFNF